MFVIVFFFIDYFEDFFVYDEFLILFFNDNGWFVEIIFWYS